MSDNVDVTSISIPYVRSPDKTSLLDTEGSRGPPAGNRLAFLSLQAVNQGPDNLKEAHGQACPLFD